MSLNEQKYNYAKRRTCMPCYGSKILETKMSQIKCANIQKHREIFISFCKRRNYLHREIKQPSKGHSDPWIQT